MVRVGFEPRPCWSRARRCGLCYELLSVFGDFNSHHSSWDSHSPEDHSGKNLFDWLLSSDLLPLNNPEHHTLLHRATGNHSSPDLSLVPARIASKCTWQTLPDLGSDHLPISITIPTSPIINSFHRPPHLTIIKLAGMITLLIRLTALLPLTLQHFLFLKPPTPLQTPQRCCHFCHSFRQHQPSC